MFGSTTLGASTLGASTVPTDISPDVELYLNRNLKGLYGAGLPAGTTYDLANANPAVLDTLNQSDKSIPPAQQPSLMGSVFNHVFQQQGQLVPIGDMLEYQKQLQQLGYMPLGYTPTGVNDPQTANAHQMLGNDVSQQLRSGAGALGTAKQGLNLLFNSSMPSHIAQGIAGFFKNMVTSAFGTVKRLSALIAAPLEGESYGAAYKDFYHHLGEDTLNVLSTIGMFTGASELFDAGRAGLGMLGMLGQSGTDAAAEFLGKTGLEEGFRATALPTVEQMMSDPSHLTRITQWALNKVPGFGGDMSDGFLKFASTYGPNRLAQMPIMQAAGGALTAGAHAAFIPQVAAVFDPNGPLGKATKSSPLLPWYADLPTFVIHPENGTVLKPKDALRAFRISSWGHLDPLRGLFDGVPDNVRSVINAQAYLKQGSADVLGQTGKDASFYAANAGIRDAEAARAHSEIARDALLDPTAPERGLKPEIIQAANEWADKNPLAVRNFAMDLAASARYREMQGLIGSNPLEDWLGATNAANTMTAQMAPQLPGFAQAANQVQEARKELDSLTTAFRSGDLGGRSPMQWQQDLQQAAQRVAQAQKAAREASPLTALGTMPRGPLDYDATPLTMADEEPFNKRVLIMRADNPRDRANLLRLGKEWEQAGDDPAARAALRPQLNQIGLGSVSDERMADNIKALTDVAATDITDRLPPEWQQEFRTRGYKAVLGGHDVILPTDVDPSAVAAPHYGKASYWLSNMGLSPIAQDPKQVGQLISSAKRRALDEFFLKEGHPLGTGSAVMQAAEEARRSQLETLGQIAGQGPRQKIMARAMAAFSIHELPQVEMRKAIQSAMGVTEDEARQLAPRVMHVMRQAQASPDLLRTPQETFSVVHRIASAMRVHGWQGIPELIRSIQIGRDGSWLANSRIGNLPDNLLKGVTALRFTLNPLFDARRAVKTPFLGMTAEDLPYEWSPKRAMARLSASTGRDINAEANNILGRAKNFDPKVLDDLDDSAIRSGVFGYNLQNHEKYDAWRLYQREYLKAGGTQAELAGLNNAGFDSLNPEADAAAIRYIQQDPKHIMGGLYGPRAPLEKSVNALFFPFSFEKKVLGQTADWLTHEPVRVFLAHALMQKIDQINKLGPDHQTLIGRALRKYAPLFNEVQKLNAFAGGISLGEWGGIYRPLGDTLGIGAKTVMGAFHPVGITQGNAAQFKALLPRLVPGWNAVNKAVSDAFDQAQVIGSSPHESHQGQLDDYFALKRAIEQQQQATAESFGLADATSLAKSSNPILQMYDNEFKLQQAELDSKYPFAASYATKYGATQQANDLNIIQTLSKVHKGPIDEGVVAMETLRNELSNLPTAAAGDPASAMLQKEIENEQMRAEGVRLLRLLGPAWNTVWTKFGYEHSYGPIAETVV